MKKNLLVLLIGLVILTPSFSGENRREESLVFSILLYGNDNDVPVHINSDRNWTDLAGIDSEKIAALNPPEEGVVRKWRVKTSYSDETMTGQSTVQIKLRTGGTRDPLFTMPWSGGVTGWKESYSNWFQTDFEGQLPLLGETAVSSARLVAPPGSSSPGIIYRIELEAWDIREIAAEENIQSIVQMASSVAIPPIKAVTEENVNRKDRLERREPDRIQALEFSLNFINSNLNGDLPAFYNSLSKTVYSLENGSGSSKYRISPPSASFESGFDFNDYTENYETKIYDYSEYIDMFPQWADRSRVWTPDRNTYLFHGSAVREGKRAILKDDLLVFMVKMIDGEWKLIAVPQ